MLILFQLMVRWFLSGLVHEEVGKPKPHGKQPCDYTFAEVLSMPRGAGPLLAIALHHHHGPTAAEAVRRLAKPEYLRLVALSQETHEDAREAALTLAKDDEALLVEIAIRDDDPELAVVAARLVRSPEQAMRLLGSKYPRVHAIAHNVLEDHRLVAHA